MWGWRLEGETADRTRKGGLFDHGQSVLRFPSEHGEAYPGKEAGGPRRKHLHLLQNFAQVQLKE